MKFIVSSISAILLALFIQPVFSNDMLMDPMPAANPAPEFNLMGMDGKTLIHPAQVDVANAAFAPSEAEIDLARRQIAAFEETEAKGEGVAVVDGKIVENLHVVTAKEILAKADAIAALTRPRSQMRRELPLRHPGAVLRPRRHTAS